MTDTYGAWLCISCYYGNESGASVREQEVVWDEKTQTLKPKGGTR